jgi:hypothetical protein
MVLVCGNKQIRAHRLVVAVVVVGGAASFFVYATYWKCTGKKDDAASAPISIIILHTSNCSERRVEFENSEKLQYIGTVRKY